MHGQSPTDETHESTTDPDAGLDRKGPGRRQPDPTARIAGASRMTRKPGLESVRRGAKGHTQAASSQKITSKMPVNTKIAADH